MEENFNNQIKEVLNNETLNQLEIISKLKHIISETEFKNYNNRPTKTMANIVSDNILKKIADPDYSQIIKTGFNAFDENFAGFTLGELIIIGARPGMGKTQLLINLCLNISKEIPILFFTFDLSSDSLSERFLSCLTGIRINNQTEVNLTQQEKNSCNGSAIFIFLNKTCFRGMFREGPNGYNVPYGNYSKPEIVNKKHLLRISKLIKNVNFTHMDFSESIKNVKTKDFVYLDPPYAPETKTSFVGYTKKGFDIELHDNLFKKCNELKDKKIKFLLSNANVELVQNAFPKEKFTIKIIVCKRSINSKKPGSKTEEVLIKSF